MSGRRKKKKKKKPWWWCWISQNSIQLTYKIDNPIRNTQSTSGFYTSPNILNLCRALGLLTARVHLQLFEILPCELDKAGDDVLADEIAWVTDGALLGHLDLELTFPKAQVEDLLDLCCARFLDLIVPGYSQVDPAEPHKHGDVCRRKEDQGYREVDAQRDVQPRVAVELDVRALQ